MLRPGHTHGTQRRMAKRVIRTHTLGSAPVTRMCVTARVVLDGLIEEGPAGVRHAGERCTPWAPPP